MMFQQTNIVVRCMVLLLLILQLGLVLAFSDTNDDLISLNFEDNIDGKFISFSKMNIRLSRQSNLDLSPSRTISSSQYERLINFNNDYQYYALKVHFKRGTIQDYVMTSIPMCLIVQTQFHYTVTLFVNENGYIVGVQVTTGNSTCNLSNINKAEEKQEYNYKITMRLQLNEVGPQPEVQQFLDKLKRQQEAKLSSQENDNRPFILKYSNSIHRHRSDQSSITEHRHAPITSVVQPDSLKVVLPPDEPILKRHLDLFSGVCFIVGIIIGSGIFVSSQGVLQETQCTFVSFLGTLCYAEIGTVIPRNGAEVAYLKEGTTKKSFGVALAFYKGLFAYGGWHNLNTVTEEIKNPQRNLWLSIVLALPCVIILYILTNISYFTVMNKAELLSSNAVAVTWGEVALGPAVRPLVILISISALGSVNVSLFGAARYCMVGAQYGYLSELFACVQTQRLTPLPGVVLVVVSSI
ncbi:unnamed protein product [Rotaria sp. Silwood2]|nr:unnamed protein product [Rotaria sp. Silwood2]